MKRTLLVTLCAVVVVTGCARIRDSKVNPFNWFGGAKQEDRFVLPEENADERGLAPAILDMKVEKYSGGVIVRATARTPSQGWWDAELVPRPIDENGVLVFDFRIFPPITQTPVGNDQSRELTAAASVSSVKMESVRKVVVQGETNALSSSR